VSAARDAAALLIEAERSRRTVSRLPEACRPSSAAEAYAIQDETARLSPPIVAWKVGSGGPGTEPTCAPVYRDRIFASGAMLDRSDVALEVEFAFRARCDLPAGFGTAAASEIARALDFMPLIEVIASRYRDPGAAGRFELLADGNGNAAFILGEPVADWQELDFRRQRVELTVDGAIVQSALDTHPLGDPLPLVAWLADHVASRCGGLKAGDIVTTGSLQGATPIARGSSALASWGRWGQVALAIAH
jgi:2-keto-4-pentenoate hydratase